MHEQKAWLDPKNLKLGTIKTGKFGDSNSALTTIFSLLDSINIYISPKQEVSLLFLMSIPGS